MQFSSSDAKAIVKRIFSEDILTLREARNELEPILGRRPDQSTLYRWCFKGVNGQKLECVKIAGRIITSKQALTRFIVNQQIPQ